jgi:hypothetical protein
MSGILRCIFVFAVLIAYPSFSWISGASFFFMLHYSTSTEQLHLLNTPFYFPLLSSTANFSTWVAKSPYIVGIGAPLPYNACYCWCFIAYYFHRFSNISVTSRRLNMSAPFRADYVRSYPYHYNTAFASYSLFSPQLLPPITLGLPIEARLSWASCS